MGLIAQVLAFTRRVLEGGGHISEVKCDPGGGALVTARHFGPAGYDSQPLPTDFVALEESPGTGQMQVSGYLDPLNEGQAGPGEGRVTARAPDGTEVAEIFARADGSISIRVLKSGGAPLRIESEDTITVHSPNVLLGDSPGRQVACVGDIVVGSLRALSTAPGNPLAPIPPMAPTPSGGIPFSAQIVSGRTSVKA